MPVNMNLTYRAAALTLMQRFDTRLPRCYIHERCKYSTTVIPLLRLFLLQYAERQKQIIVAAGACMDGQSTESHGVVLGRVKRGLAVNF